MVDVEGCARLMGAGEIPLVTARFGFDGANAGGKGKRLARRHLRIRTHRHPFG